MTVSFWRRLLAVAILAICALATMGLPAAAHGFTSAVYVELTEPADGVVRAEVELEYVLLVISAAKAEDDPELEREAKATFRTSGADVGVLDTHAETVLAYVRNGFGVALGGEDCSPSQVGDFRASERDGVPHTIVVLDFSCPASSDSAAAYEVTSELFPKNEGFVGSTDTILEYDLHGSAGNAVLTADDPTFVSDKASSARLGEFFVLGVEHLLFGIDHILFLLALIVGSRRLRDILLAASAFTAAHSLTFILAGLGVVSVPAAIVEPVIALSISAAAGWHVWGAWRSRAQQPPRTGNAASLAATAANLRDDSPASGSTATLTSPVKTAARTAADGPVRRRVTSAELARLGVVFAFGLIHGLGFAGALGIDEPFSWALLSSLLVFNVGIELVQLAIIVVVFPLLLLLRRRLPPIGLWLGVVVAAGVAVVGLFWFVQRLFGLG
ncbi:HupE/UreJ family protein [Actinopolymorpha alba]|uniref:HupE/UreJ family protein n=1 Tax=Actinopolymorpha alba TaxID=533267 RepID=UPI000381A7CF|nr:HupE/UreJ family protein [Actinopolymorpha alba]